MATVQKKPRRLPKLPDKKDENDKDKSRDAKGDSSKKKVEEPPPGKRKELPPLKRRGKKGGFSDTKSMMDMGRSSPVNDNHRPSLTATHNSKCCYFYIDDDYFFPPIKMVIHPKQYRRLDTVSRDLTQRMKRNLPFGVRNIFTSDAQQRVHNLEDLTQDGHYICTHKRTAKGIDVARVSSKLVWHSFRPDSGRRKLNGLLKDVDIDSAKPRGGFRPGYDLSNIYTRMPSRTITVMRNGQPGMKYSLLLNRRTAHNYEQVLKTLSESFQIAIRKIYTLEGEEMVGLQKIWNGPDKLVAVAGHESFINLDFYSQSRARTRNSMGSRMNLQSRMQSRLQGRRDRMTKTRGKWIVTVRTNALPSAGTQAQVTITVYGNKGNSGALTLGHGDGRDFQPGSVDEFEISAGNVGEVYKIRLAHDNSGDFPGWLCDEVKMVDKDSGEELTFSCRRWLARDEDDQEITRELAVKRPGDPILPLIKYQVDVYTGDMWGGGTDANVYITMYGDRGDTGVRQLYAETKGVYFKQGQMDTFEVEAVSLGHLKRIIVGHDGTGNGNGWFLDKIVIREPPFRPNMDNVFHCGKWLDEGEDDGKIVRELKVQDEYMDDILEKRNWEFEKWKYEKGSKVILFSIMTGKPLRLNKDLTVDGFAEEKDPLAVFSVQGKKPMKPMFSSVALPNHFLAIDNGKITGLGKGGPYCEFRVRAQQDGTTLFESVKNPLQFLTIGADGYPAEVRGVLDKEPTRRFYVYAKGCFRHQGVIMLGTSQQQTINISRDDNTLSGRGRRTGSQAHFKVHKVSAGGIRMFESAADPGNFIRLKDGKIDCKGSKGEECCQFLVLRHKDKGYITLQSAYQRGLFMGMTTDGKVHTTIDTGVRNIWLYPEVIEWGIPKVRSTAIVEEEVMQMQRRDMTPVSIRSEAAPSPKPSKQFAEGDWSISVSTLNELSNGDVALVAYGDKGSSGPIVLAAPPGKPVFQEGNEDEFRANLLKIGTMYKIRLELIPKSSTKSPSWKVKEVKMQDLNTNEVLKFPFNRWLSREEEDKDTMRELPVVRPGENVLPVLTYMVTITTGKEKGSETDVPIYITASGERGDWGKRYLQDSNNVKKFRIGQVDIFYIEAVSLGNLQRCVIGHDGTGAGEGWYCEQVVIKESDKATDLFVFPCNRWLDTSMEDRRIERSLTVKEQTKKAPGEKSKYLIEVVTGQESGSPNGGRVHITLYGTNKKSDQVFLYASDPNQKTFEPGNIDRFTVETDDLGDLYKIRMGREDTDTWDRWFLEEVRMTDEATQEKKTFSFQRWLARDMDDGDLDRELPVVHPGKPVPVLLQYQVQVYTGDHWGASTDANMYITINGTHGDSGRRLLHKCTNNRVKFRRGQMDTFEFDVVNLEELTSVLLCHDGRGHGAGVFVDRVVVKEKDTDNSHLQHIFPCGRWLDDHEDDCLTERTLRLIDVVDTKQPAPAKTSQKSNGHWSVTVKTSSFPNMATTSRAYITVYGTSGHSDKQHLTLKDKSAGVFSPGAESQFLIETGNIGRVTKIRLEHDNFGSSPDWRVDYVKMKDSDTGEELVFYLDRWLALDQDDGQICREVPVVRKGAASLPVLRYVVAVTTGSYKDAGIDNGTVSINLIGVDGDTGLRELAGPISKNRLPWQSGQTDVYKLEAVSVGKLKKIELKFLSAGQDRWYVQQVCVAEGTRSPTQYVSTCHQWMLSSDTQVADFTATDVQPSTSLIDLLESIPKGLQKPVRSKGRWTVYVQTGTQNDSGTKEKVVMVLCGLKGESDPIQINAKDDLNPGSFIKFEAKISDIGLLFKVRVSFTDQHFGSSWFLNKMKLKDKDTGEELIFEHNDWIESTNDNPEGVMELSAVRPDLQPLKEQIYIVSVKTGDLPRAETDSHVRCCLVGQWGTSGQRTLAVSSNNIMFRPGQVDEFTLTSLELGAIQQLIFDHDGTGRGHGWYCDTVTIKVAEETQTVFPCHRWIDTGCADRKLCVELSPLAKYPLDYTTPTRYLKSTGGKWNFHVTYAGLDQLPKVKPGQRSGEVSIVVYGSESVQGPLELTAADDPNSPVSLFCPGKTDHFFNYDLSDIGEIKKIRVSYGYEGDTQSVWTISQVVLEEQNTKDLLTFDFRSWVGEVGGDIRKEMPLVKPDNSHKHVVKYYIEVHTSEAEMSAATNANVFMTLYGSDSDSGRRHLIHSRDSDKRFQAGQVDRFELEAVDLGKLEKLVIAKGPGKPWLLEKIVVKQGEFAPEEHVFLFEGWIGDKSSQGVEVEETLKVTAAIPSNIAIPLQEAPHLDTSKGSWRVESVTGGRRGTDGPLDLLLVFCGQDKESAPVPLVSDRDTPLEIGQTDVFKVKYNEKIGELRKVRLGFQDQSTTKAWFVRKLTFEDDDTKDIFWTEVNEWVAVDNKLDGWKEIPVPWPAVPLQPVVRYVVTLKVGAVNSDWSDSDVYIIVYGDQGGTGRRLLKHSISNTEKIRQNQVDVFELEAVHLGELVKLTIGHNNQTHKCGFYLDRVVVQESPDAPEIIFECNNWLDAGEADGQTERTLVPSQSGGNLDNTNNNAEVIVPLLSPKPSTPEVEKEPEVEQTREVEQDVEETVQQVANEPTEPPKDPTPIQGSLWSITTTTGGDAGEGTGSPVVIILYGEKGHSMPHVLGGEEDFRFSMGNTDNFNITVQEEIGELFKVRIGFDDLGWLDSPDQAPTWYLEKLTLRNEDDKKVYEFDAGIWVKVTSYQDYWRELPVKRRADQLSVYEYKVSIFTGEESKAGTDANVYLQIFGECGDTGYRKLMASKTHSNKFEKGNKDVFEIGAVDLGKLTKIKVKHDGSGPGSGWFLDRVVIQETEETTIRYVFRYGRWLDEGDGESGVEQTLMLSDILVSDEEDQTQDLPGLPWQVVMVTGDQASQGTDCPAALVLYDVKGRQEHLVVGEREGFRFNIGATDTFNVRVLEDLQDLYKVRIGFHGDMEDAGWFEDFHQSPTWLLKQLSLKNETTNKEYEVKAPTWLKVDEYQDYWREQPIMQADGSLPEVYQYQVEIYTGDKSKAGTDAKVSICIYGDKGDTGLRRLMTSKTNLDKFEQGNRDLFEVQAVDLGSLTKVKVSHDGSGVGSGWFLDKIVIKETEESQTKYVFKCDQWLDVAEGERTVTQEFSLTDVVEGEEEKEEKEDLTGHPWTIWCVTGQDVGEGTDNPVELILYGNLGNSAPVIIGGDEDFRFNRAQVDMFEVRADGEVGELYKVRVGFHGGKYDVPWFQNYHLAPSWFIESLKLRDEVTGQEYQLEAGVSVQVEQYTDFWRELPVVNTNNKLPVYQYHVEVYTGEQFRAGTDANVTLQIFGERGDTGLRRLMNSKTNTNKFEGGKDVFEIQAVDLGQLVKVKVSHDGSGAGSGWLLEKVIVMERDDSELKYVFECGQWLEEGKDEQDVEITLPLTDVIHDNALTTQAKEEQQSPTYKAGDWKVLVTTGDEAESGTDSNVTLTVYGDADNTGPIQLGSATLGFFYSGKTDEFDVFLDPEELGQIRKIRLEHDNSGKAWNVQKVVLRNMTDKTEIEFPINQWLTLDQRGCDIAVEAPTQGHNWPVREYLVRTLTGEEFGAGTDAGVYIKLIGTLGDSGKRWLAHNLEGTEEKFEAGQVDSFVVKAVDLGRLLQVQVGHNGRGPGSGWFLRKVMVKESQEAEDRYVFTCEQWLHDEKEDGLTERLLSLDRVEKDSQPFAELSQKADDIDEAEKRDDRSPVQEYNEADVEEMQGADKPMTPTNKAEKDDDVQAKVDDKKTDEGNDEKEGNKVDVKIDEDKKVDEGGKNENKLDSDQEVEAHEDTKPNKTDKETEEQVHDAQESRTQSPERKADVEQKNDTKDQESDKDNKSREFPDTKEDVSASNDAKEEVRKTPVQSAEQRSRAGSTTYRVDKDDKEDV